MRIHGLCLLLMMLLFQKADGAFLSPPNITQSELEKVSAWESEYQARLDGNYSKHNVEPAYINELVLSQSAYLLQHAHNPINWKPWSSKVLQQAKRENKLIFLSIGYSTCHWCHVMERESFSQVDVAQAINQHYIAVKVDREVRPDIDAYYATALEQVKGSAGWPITVIINGDGLPLFIDSYLPKDKLLRLIKKIHLLWGTQPEFLLSAGENIHTLVSALSKGPSALSKARLPTDDLNQKLIAALDPIHGGFLGEVKFPSAPLLLYMLDQLQRKPNVKLEQAVKHQLDIMAQGGLFDHVEGGFHRYATDRTWMVPHYEKMLYNQGQLLQVYSEAYDYFKDPSYAYVLTSITEFLLTSFYQPNAGFSTAFDAEFKGEEGGYYTWSKTELDELLGGANTVRTYPLESLLSKNQKFGVLLPLLDSKENTQLRQALKTSRQSKGVLRRDDKILTGWNGLAIKGLLAASSSLSAKNTIEQAASVAQYLWQDRFHASTGQLNRTTHGGAKNDIRYLEDYAYLADAFVALYDATGDSVWLHRSEQLVGIAAQSFYRVNEAVLNAVGGSDVRALAQYNDTELLAPVAVLFDVLIQLQRRTGAKQNKPLILHIGALLTDAERKGPLNHLYSARVLSRTNEGVAQGVRYFAKGKGSVRPICRQEHERICIDYELQFALDDGWHINAQNPYQDYLVPTEVVLPEGFVVHYPKAKEVSLGFQKEPLRLYEGRFSIRIQRTNSKTQKQYVKLPLQACSDELCLLPETIKLSF